MQRTRLAVPLIALALGACASTPAPVPEVPEPLPQHQQLQKGVGTWEGTLTMFMPDTPVQAVACKEVVEPIGLFWTQSQFTSDFMGMPFRGSACMGYDPYKERYVGTWIDSETTELAVMTGEMDLDGNTLVMRWTQRDPDSGVPTPHRVETTFHGDSYTSDFFHGNGSGVKMMTIEMKRVASAAHH